MNGLANANIKYTSTTYTSGFCGGRTGSLVLGQEQDSVGGGFAANQASDCAIDTLAIYDEWWSATTVAARDKTCINLHDDALCVSRRKKGAVSVFARRARRRKNNNGLE